MLELKDTRVVFWKGGWVCRREEMNKLGLTRMNWIHEKGLEHWRVLTTSNLDGVEVLQEKLVLFLTELSKHLPQVWEKLEEEPGEARAVAGPPAASGQ